MAFRWNYEILIGTVLLIILIPQAAQMYLRMRVLVKHGMTTKGTVLWGRLALSGGIFGYMLAVVMSFIANNVPGAIFVIFALTVVLGIRCIKPAREYRDAINDRDAATTVFLEESLRKS